MAVRSEPVEPNFNEMLESIRGVTAASIDVRSHEPPLAEFPADEYRLRYAKACKLMEEHDLDALLVTQDIDVRYFTGYLSILWCSRFRPYVGILPRDPSLGPVLVVPAQETGNAVSTSWIENRVIYPDQDDPSPHIAQAILDLGLKGGRIGTELGFGQRLGMTINQFEAVKGAIRPAQFVNGTPVIQAVRMVKSPSEVECLRRACEISQAGVRAGWEALRPGMTEKELARVMGATMYAEGAELGTQPSFLALFGGPDRYMHVNALASDNVLGEGDLVMIDGGAVFHGYSTDFIRQACIGDPTPEQRRFFDICVEANNVAIDAIRPGAEGADVYAAGVAVFEREGLMEYNVLNIVGHGTGMEVHELPWLGEGGAVYTSSTVLEPGMVVCIEPVIGGMDEWRTGTFIVEDKVLVTETGAEVLTNALDKDLWVQPVVAAAII